MEPFDLKRAHEKLAEDDVLAGEIRAADPHQPVTWAHTLRRNCPMLQELITDYEGVIDPDELESLLQQLNLTPCPRQDDDCLNRNCAILWRYYVQHKYQVRNRDEEDPANLDLSAATLEALQTQDAKVITRTLFQTDTQLKFAPSELSPEFELKKHGQDRWHVYRRHGVATLHRLPTYHPGYEIMRFAQARRPGLSIHFVRLLAVFSTRHRGMFVLSESMTGLLTSFVTRFQDTDPHFPTRLRQILAHAWTGLTLWHDLGYILGPAARLMFRLDAGARRVTCKWGNFDTVQEATPKLVEAERQRFTNMLQKKYHVQMTDLQQISNDMLPPLP